MTQIRQSQTRQLQSMFPDLTDSLIVYSRGWTASEAMDAFIGGFNQLSNAPIDPVQQQSIVDYYKRCVRQGRGRADRPYRRCQRTVAHVERAAIPAGALHRALRRPERGGQER